MIAAQKMTALENRISELEQENKHLHDTVEYLTRKLFGRSSEKTSALSLGQLSFLMKQKQKPTLKHRNLT